MTEQSNSSLNPAATSPGKPDAGENGYQRRRRETRQSLVEAGRALFIERPVEQVSIESITARAGVAKGSFYNHFDSREALFEEIIEATVADFAQKHQSFESPLEDPLEFALARSRFAFYTLLSDLEACHLLIQAGHPAPGGPVDRVLQALLSDTLFEGIALGTLSHLDPQLVYAAYFGVMTQTMTHVLTQENPQDPEIVAAQVTELIFAVLGLPHQSGAAVPPQLEAAMAQLRHDQSREESA